MVLLVDLVQAGVQLRVDTWDEIGQERCSNVRGLIQMSVGRRTKRMSENCWYAFEKFPLTVNLQSIASQNSFSSRFISTTLTPPTRAYLPFVQNASLNALLPTLTAAIMNRWTVKDEIVKVFILAQTVKADTNHISHCTEVEVWESRLLTFIDIWQQNEKTTWFDVCVASYSE